MSKYSGLSVGLLLLAVGSSAFGANGVVNRSDAVPNFNIRAACRALARVPEARLAGVDQADAPSMGPRRSAQSPDDDEG